MPKTFNGVAAEILLVEDSEGDARPTREALADGKVNNRLNHVTDGVQAMQYLRREGEFSEAQRPDLILLDLNVPQMNDIKSDPSLCSIPVISPTTSASDRDIIESYTRQASCYISKPVEFDDFLDVVRSIEDFWLSIVRLPDTSLAYPVFPVQKHRTDRASLLRPQGVQRLQPGGAS